MTAARTVSPSSQGSGMHSSPLPWVPPGLGLLAYSMAQNLTPVASLGFIDPPPLVSPTLAPSMSVRPQAHHNVGGGRYQTPPPLCDLGLSLRVATSLHGVL